MIIKKKYTLYIVIAFTLILFVTGCGLPKEYDFSSEKEFYNKNSTEIIEIFDLFELYNWKSVYKNHSDNKLHYSINGTEDDPILSDKYPTVEKKIIDLDITNVYKSNSDDIIIESNKNGWYFKSYKDIEDIECPYFFSKSKKELKSLNLEKEIDGDKIHFIADHRKDKKTNWKGMYYRIDVEKLDNYIYVYQMQRKYPWTSNFIE